MTSVTTRPPLSIDEFLAMPETKPASEYACGEVFRKPMPNNAHGILQPYIWLPIFRYLSDHPLGRVRTEWRCVFGPPRRRRGYVPDVVYASYQRLPPGDPIEQKHLTVAPDLVVEVLSPGESARRFASKLRFYLNSGVRVVWVADPATRTIAVYVPGQADEQILREGDVLDGGDVLPGFSVPVAEIMAQVDVEKP